MTEPRCYLSLKKKEDECQREEDVRKFEFDDFHNEPCKAKNAADYAPCRDLRDAYRNAEPVKDKRNRCANKYYSEKQTVSALFHFFNLVSSIVSLNAL